MIGLFRTNRMLREKIQDLQNSLNISAGANEVLRQQLIESQRANIELLDKIFTITGVNRPPVPVGLASRSPQPLNTRGLSWKNAKQTLEQQSQEKYWEEKKRKIDETLKEASND